MREPVIDGSRRTDLVLLALLTLVAVGGGLFAGQTPLVMAGYLVLTALMLPSVMIRRYRPRTGLLMCAVPATIGYAVGFPSPPILWAVAAFALFRAPGRAAWLLATTVVAAGLAAWFGPWQLHEVSDELAVGNGIAVAFSLLLHGGVGAVLGRATRFARAREAERRRVLEAERLAAALTAERTRIADEVGSGVLQGLRRLAERAGAPADAVASLQEEARAVLTGMRRALVALREPASATGSQPWPERSRLLPSRSGIALAVGLGVAAAGIGLLPLRPIGQVAIDRLTAQLDVPWSNPLSLALLLVQLAAIGWWRSAPIPAFLVTTVAAIANGALGGTNEIVESGWMVLAYGVGVGAGVRISAAVVAVASAAVLAATLSVPAIYAQNSLGTGGIVVSYLVVPLLWLVGVTRRGHRVRAEQARAERRAAAEHRAREGERLRVARELHDVVAHHVSAISVQAGAASVTTDPAVREQALAHIAESGRRVADALPELAGLTPDPGGVALTADGLEQLVRPVRDAGLPVTCAVAGDPVEPPGDADLFGRRIVTEALTNVLRHAGHSTTRVRVEHGPDAVELRIADAGPVPGHPPYGSGSGLGLLGMRERADLLGGRVEAGPGDDGGWCVRAHLPRRDEPSGGVVGVVSEEEATADDLVRDDDAPAGARS